MPTAQSRFARAVGHAEVLVQLAAHDADRAVADDGERGAHVHAGQKPAAGAPSRSVP